MDKTILEAIKKKAEEKYKKLIAANVLARNGNRVVDMEREAYASGCIEGIELMKGLIKYMVERKVSPINWDMWEDWGASEPENQIVPMKKLDQLLSEYIKTLKNG